MGKLRSFRLRVAIGTEQIGTYEGGRADVLVHACAIRWRKRRGRKGSKGSIIAYIFVALKVQILPLPLVAKKSFF